jgi:hypothetical protein
MGLPKRQGAGHREQDNEDRKFGRVLSGQYKGERTWGTGDGGQMTGTDDRDRGAGDRDRTWTENSEQVLGQGTRTGC